MSPPRLHREKTGLQTDGSRSSHQRYYKPEIHLRLANELKKFASSSIDVSDGLIADLEKLINNLNVLWMCDPMHGNTFKTQEGFKTRDFDDIIYELRNIGEKLV